MKRRDARNRRQTGLREEIDSRRNGGDCDPGDLYALGGPSLVLRELGNCWSSLPLSSACGTLREKDGEAQSTILRARCSAGVKTSTAMRRTRRISMLVPMSTTWSCRSRRFFEARKEGIFKAVKNSEAYAVTGEWFMQLPSRRNGEFWHGASLALSGVCFEILLCRSWTLREHGRLSVAFGHVALVMSGLSLHSDDGTPWQCWTRGVRCCSGGSTMYWTSGATTFNKNGKFKEFGI